MPHVIVLAGPNGAGKSTTAPRLLRNALAVEEFVNADAIALGLSAFHPDRVAVAAGRILLTRLRELSRQKSNLAFESTLASRTFAPWLKALRGEGYRVTVLFLWLSTPELAVSRVVQRVRLGGHAVPEEVIRRRHARGVRNFFAIYRPLADEWRFFDNSGFSPRLMARGRGNVTNSVTDKALWAKLEAAYGGEA